MPEKKQKERMVLVTTAHKGVGALEREIICEVK